MASIMLLRPRVSGKPDDDRISGQFRKGLLGRFDLRRTDFRTLTVPLRKP